MFSSNVIITIELRGRKQSFFKATASIVLITHFTYIRPIVSCWGDGGPDSRIELKGIFPGATVSMGPEWPFEREVINLF